MARNRPGGPALSMNALPDLLSALRSGDDSQAEEAAQQLKEYGLAALQALQQLLNDPQPDTRWWAVRALAAFPPESAAGERILPALQDPSPEVRQAAALGLTHQPTPQALTALTAALQDPDSLTASLAANALIALGPQAVPALLQSAENASPAAKIEAIRALAELRDHRAIPALMKAFQSPSALQRYWGEQGLQKLGLEMTFFKPQ